MGSFFFLSTASSLVITVFIISSPGSLTSLFFPLWLLRTPRHEPQPDTTRAKLWGLVLLRLFRVRMCFGHDHNTSQRDKKGKQNTTTRKWKPIKQQQKKIRDLAVLVHTSVTTGVYIWSQLDIYIIINFFTELLYLSSLSVLRREATKWEWEWDSQRQRQVNRNAGRQRSKGERQTEGETWDRDGETRRLGEKQREKSKGERDRDEERDREAGRQSTTKHFMSRSEYNHLRSYEGNAAQRSLLCPPIHCKKWTKQKVIRGRELDALHLITF